jgi:hypothetical protein
MDLAFAVPEEPLSGANSIGIEVDRINMGSKWSEEEIEIVLKRRPGF